MRKSSVEFQGSGAPVLVIGGGVSGCACAATLAERGVNVLVVSEALDRTGMPAYGPDLLLRGDWMSVVEELDRVPKVIRDVWICAAVASSEGGGFVSVDRRMASVEMKRALEQVAGVRFRQGLVSALEVGTTDESASGRLKRERPVVRVKTVFGETSEGAVAVVAAGLGLGGGVAVAAGEGLAARWHGVTTSQGLRGALERLGCETGEATVKVGARYSARVLEAAATAWADRQGESGGACLGGARVVRTMPLARVTRRGEKPSREHPSRGGRTEWPGTFPPAPHWTQGLHVWEAVVGEIVGGEAPLVLADGCATGEVYVVPGRGEAPVEGRLMASRPKQALRGAVATNLGRGGRLGRIGGGSLPVWVTGRAAGCQSYLESIIAGVRSGDEVADVVGGRAGYSPGDGAESPVEGSQTT